MLKFNPLFMLFCLIVADIQVAKGGLLNLSYLSIGRFNDNLQHSVWKYRKKSHLTTLWAKRATFICKMMNFWKGPQSNVRWRSVYCYCILRFIRQITISKKITSSRSNWYFTFKSDVRFIIYTVLTFFKLFYSN